MNFKKVAFAFVFVLVLPLYVSAQVDSVFSASVGNVSLVRTGGEYQVDFSLSGTKGFSSTLSYALALKQAYNSAATFTYYGSQKSEKNFSITSGATVSFSDTFSVPEYVSGEQDLYLVLTTVDGVPIQEFSIGKVSAPENKPSAVSFDFNDCYIGITDPDMKNAPKTAQEPRMPLGRFIGGFSKDIATVHCGVLFNSASPAAYYVGFRVHEAAMQGAVIQEGIAGKEVTFTKGKKNAVDVAVSDFGVTGRVLVELFLVDADKKQATPPLTLSYDIAAKKPVGSIDGAFMDSDSYKKGDEIKAFVLSSLVPKNYSTVHLSVKNSSGAVCADEKVAASDIGTLITATSENNCSSPKVEITLLNKDDAEIGYLAFAYPARPLAGNLLSGIIALAGIIAAVFLFFALKRRSNKISIPPAMMMLLLGFGLSASLSLQPHTASAQTLSGGACGVEYTTPGTYSFTTPSWVSQITVSGSGGGAGGVGGAWDSAGSSPRNGGGGGAAAVSNSDISVSPSSGYTAVVGSGGSGGAAEWNSGGVNPVGTHGGETYISSGSGTRIVSLPGGRSGDWGGDYYNAGGAGGGAGGQAGAWGYRGCGGTGGKGGNSLFGAGGAGVFGAAARGNNGSGYGAGGGGASGGCRVFNYDYYSGGSDGMRDFINRYSYIFKLVNVALAQTFSDPSSPYADPPYDG
ncbi:hypothetical protein HY412_01960, partial [Candidatus Kaiserbacteria bacterium]|nr:hypothetical protein [Candidatus Kaiserbacteria bacterium]